MKKTSLFLIEMLIAIFIFALASGVCVQLFVKSHLLSQESIDLQQATLKAQNLAEMFYASDLSEQVISDFPVVYYDSNWQPTQDEGSASYCSFIICDSELPAGSGMIYAQVMIKDLNQSKSSEIYSLSLEKYMGGTVDE